MAISHPVLRTVPPKPAFGVETDDWNNVECMNSERTRGVDSISLLPSIQCGTIPDSRLAAAIGTRVTDAPIEAPASSARFGSRGWRLGRRHVPQVRLDLPDAKTGVATTRTGPPQRFQNFQ